MYLKKKKMPDGDIYLSIMDKFYDPEKKYARERTVEGIGYVSELEAEYPDPIAYFTERAKRLTLQKKEEQQCVLTLDLSSKMDVTTDEARNVGYGILKELYKDLELDKFWIWKTRNLDVQYNVDQIFRLLVFARVLFPDSKRGTFEDRKQFFEDFNDFTLDDVYRCLDVIQKNQDALQQWIFKRSDKIYPRDLSVAYYDCTNYYFDIGRPDVDLKDEDGQLTEAAYRKRGPEKNRRPDPIVQMGLLTDRNGIPLAFELFPGNESEKLHLRPTVRRVKQEYSDTRVIYVADRALNTADNIYFINGDNKEDYNPRDGYVYGQTIRGADAEFKAYVLAGGYRTEIVLDDNGNEIKFIHKSRIYPKEINVHVTKPGQKKKSTRTVRVDQKQMVYYSEKYARKQRKNREAMIERAKDLIQHPKKYDRVSSAGSAAYVVNLAFNKTSGEIVEGRHLYLDTERIKEEEKYDGYYSIVTSELKMSDRELRNLYRGLAKIEDTFKISKSEFSSRPIFVRTNEHIDAHFTTCFTALVIIRLLQAKLQNKFPVGQILESLRKYCCVPLDSTTYQFIYYDEVLEACAEIFNKEYNRKYLTRQQIQRLLRY
jgi:hypothetical protein